MGERKPRDEAYTYEGTQLEPQNDTEREMTDVERRAYREALAEDQRRPVIATDRPVDEMADHELPPSQRRVQYGPGGTMFVDNEQVFTRQQIAQLGLRDNELLKLLKTSAQKINGGLAEWDAETEMQNIRLQQLQNTRMAVIDQGNAVKTQFSVMEAYFAGTAPRGDGQYCRRRKYTNPTNKNQIVGINGYFFDIPPFKEVHVPEEVLEILHGVAVAQEQLQVLSAIYMARQHEPIHYREAGEYLNFRAEQIAQRSRW